MKLKTDDSGHVVVADGKPVYVHDDGKEVPFDAAHTLATISRLNGEAKSHREAKEALEGRMKGFEGLEPDAARKALETVKNFADGDLVKAGKVEEMKQAWERASKDEREAAVRGVAEDRDRWKGEAEKLQGSLYRELVGGSFSRSRFVSDKVAIPPDLLQARFGDRFKVENGRVVGLGQDGQPIYSRTKAGEVAEFDEALESMIDAYPHRDSILKGSNSSGSGAGHGRGNGNGAGGRTMTQAQFDAMDPLAQARLMSGKDRPAIVG